MLYQEIFDYWKNIDKKELKRFKRGKISLKSLLGKKIKNAESLTVSNLTKIFNGLLKKAKLNKEDDAFVRNVCSIVNDTWVYIYKLFPVFTKDLSSIFSITIMIGFHCLFYPVFAGKLLEKYSEKCAIFMLLYAYVDYYLDDPDISMDNKKSFMKYIPERINKTISDDNYKEFDLIMTKFEEQYPRDKFKKPYEALMYAYDIEVKSVKLQYESDDIEEHEKLMIEKGISTMILYLYMEEETPDKKILDLCIKDVAIIGQLTDDLMDLEKDMRENRDTAVSLCVKKNIPLDIYYLKLEYIFDSYIESLESLEDKKLKYLITFMKLIEYDYISAIIDYNRERITPELLKNSDERASVDSLREIIREYRKKIPLDVLREDWIKFNNL